MAANETEFSKLGCREHECAWSGHCVFNAESGAYKMENDNLKFFGDLQISGYYENAHTIILSFPKYFDTTDFFILEFRPVLLVGNLDTFRFSNISKQTTFIFRIPKICDRYEFRLTAVLKNGSAIMFDPKMPNINPPDFTLDNIRVNEISYDARRHLAVATVTWKHPFGYSNADIDKYESYLHTLDCEVSSDLLNEPMVNIIKNENGGRLNVTFPQAMIDRKCAFQIMLWAIDTCGNRTLTEAKVDIILNCTTVENYECPRGSLRPFCFSHLSVMAASKPNETDAQISIHKAAVCVSWMAPSRVKPHYFHLRWGVAESVDLRSQKRSSETSNEASQKSNFGSEFKIWMLRPGEIKEEKIDGNSSNTILADLFTGIRYGIQLCAIFNNDFKKPEWAKVTTNGFSCGCDDVGCAKGYHCETLDASQRTTPEHLSSLATTPELSETTVSTTVPPHMAPKLALSPPPNVIETVRDFTQNLLFTERDGLRLRLTWLPPRNLQMEQISNYVLSLITLSPCVHSPVCCDYATSAEIDQSHRNNTGMAEIFLPRRVLRARCAFLVKIITTATNGASGVSYKNIRVPFLPRAPNGLVSFSEDAANSVIVSSSKNVSTVDSVCHALGCSHDCNDTHCLCPEGLQLDEDGRTCLSNSSSVLDFGNVFSYDCRVRFGCYYDLCDDRGCICPNGSNISSDGISCLTTTEIGVAILHGEPRDTILDPCQLLGCKFSCNARNECVCPFGMNLNVDGKSCFYKDPDVWNATAPVPFSTPFALPMLCATPSRYLFSISKDQKSNVCRIAWKSNDTIFSGFSCNSTVRIRTGAAQKNFNGALAFYRLAENATTASGTLCASSMEIALPISLLHYTHLGVQFCIFNAVHSKQFDESPQWDILPVVLIKTADEMGFPAYHESEERDSTFIGENSVLTNGNKLRESSNHVLNNRLSLNGSTSKTEHLENAKELMALCAVVPLSIFIISISIVVFLFYFRPTLFRKFVSRFRSPPERQTNVRDGTASSSAQHVEATCKKENLGENPFCR